MSSATRPYWLTLLGSVLVVAGAFAIPQVSEASKLPSGTPEFVALVKAEYAFCNDSELRVNCGCFSRKSGHIQSHETVRVQGYLYAHSQDLARGQAKRVC